MRFFLFLLFINSALADVRLTIGGKSAELEDVVVEAQLHGRFLVRHLTLTFHNAGGRRTEGDLTCPLAEGEEVVSFAMDVNGVRRDGVVVPKKRGRIAYETIVRRGVDPGLIEVNEVTNEFRTRVFPIPARGNKTVWITTVQLVEKGEVRVWPKGLGSPGKWDFSLETAGGEAGDFSHKQSGDTTTAPRSSLSWEPTPDLAYRSDEGDLHFIKKKAAKLSAETLEVWLDGTAKIDPSVQDRVAELLGLYQNAKVTLRVFREEVSEPREFLLREGAAPELLETLSKTYPIGMARPRGLPWKTVRADAVILITDGTFVSGREGLGDTPCPLHVIDSGKGTSRWLRNRALLSGGGWHRLAELDSLMGELGPEATQVGEVVGEMMMVKPAEAALETPIGKWLWARIRSQEMNDTGQKRSEIDDFNYRHGVMDSESSMIVMETARQYQEFKIEPPKEEKRLYAEWQVLQKKRGTGSVRNYDRLAQAWQKRCDHLAAPVPPFGDRLKDYVEARRKQLLQMEEMAEGADFTMIEPLRAELLTIDKLCGEGVVEKGKMSEVKAHLEKLAVLETDFKAKNPWALVTVGGTVSQSGQFYLPIGSTLYDAVQAAGGGTPFGAINRTKLYRNGKVYTYNMKLEKHRGVRVYSGDVVDVPQKKWLGNGGSEGRTRAPFSAAGNAQIAFEKGDAHPPKDYLDALAKVLGDDEGWEDRYRFYRAACGWRADFYLNVIEFLREKGETSKALRVAGELAEHMPESPEILRRAARAYRRLGALELSHELFVQILKLRPGDAMALYDLARSEEARGNPEVALSHYWKALGVSETRYTQGRSLVILEELNALLSREEIKGEDWGIDPRLIRHVPVELRVVLEWDADQSNLDLIGGGVTAGWLSPVQGAFDLSGAWRSGDVSRGYGPESLSLQGLFPGGYSFGARFYGDWRDKEKSTVTAEVQVIYHFGTPEEIRQIHTLRLAEKTHGEIVKARVTLPGWE